MNALYIPHSSYKTPPNGGESVSEERLYIPHSSYKTKQKNV